MSENAAIRQIQGRGVPLSGNDIDTDRIIPARFLRAITFAGLGEQVFRDERFDADGVPRAHPFNDERYRGAEILVVNTNFGCGSSREHAPQALQRFGIKAIIGESFAEIFAGNCTSIGLAVCTMANDAVVALQQRLQREPSILLTVDIEALTLQYGDRQEVVAMQPSARTALLDGTWDTLDVLLRNADQIDQVHTRLPMFFSGA